MAAGVLDAMSMALDGYLQQKDTLLCAVVAASLCYASGFVMVFIWTAWSINKHGWCRRSLRRFSYLLFLLMFAVRLVWCAVLLSFLCDKPLTGQAAVHSTFAVAFDHAAFVVHVRVLSSQRSLSRALARSLARADP
jgi:hypothetical protein